MGIVGDPPSPVSLYMISIFVFVTGIVDFFSPEKHIGAILLTIVGVFAVFHYIMTHSDKPHTIKMKVTENGETHEEDWNDPGGATIKTLAIGCGLVTISAITYFIPWLRLTSLVFIFFGTYSCGIWVWIIFDSNFGKGEEKK
jgi:hypothetical protein